MTFAASPTATSVRALPAVLITAALVAAPSPAASQTVDGQSVTDRLGVLAEENARRYLHPVSSGLGAGLNSGFFQTAWGADEISVRAGLQVSGSLIPASADSFSPELPSSLSYGDRNFEDPYEIRGESSTSPTASGRRRGVVLEPSDELEQEIRDAGEDPADFRISFPDGVDLPAVPLIMGEASAELPTGTGVMARFLPSIEVSQELGSISAWGFGVRQTVTGFLEDPPVDVGVAAGYQSLSLGDVVDASGRSLDLVVSRDLDLIPVFASGGLGGSSVEAEYTFDSPTDIPGQPADGETISFEDDGANSGASRGACI